MVPHTTLMDQLDGTIMDQLLLLAQYPSWSRPSTRHGPVLVLPVPVIPRCTMTQGLYPDSHAV